MSRRIWLELRRSLSSMKISENAGGGEGVDLLDRDRLAAADDEETSSKDAIWRGKVRGC